jgi:hypothetical protein
MPAEVIVFRHLKDEGSGDMPHTRSPWGVPVSKKGFRKINVSNHLNLPE